MGCYCRQETVTPSKDPGHPNSSAVCPCHPAITCVSNHATAPMSHFSTSQCSSSHGKGVTRLSPHCYYPSLACPIPRLSPIEHIWDYLGRRVGHPASLNEVEAMLQQIGNEISQDITQNLLASMPDRIAL
ncbi:uncharacterized protein TNCV_130611 [Trichonephila clavipes]|nr:uncharacterized protein TNCV_130611 [Trichonephila clavipes]